MHSSEWCPTMSLTLPHCSSTYVDWLALNMLQEWLKRVQWVEHLYMSDLDSILDTPSTKHCQE